MEKFINEKIPFCHGARMNDLWILRWTQLVHISCEIVWIALIFCDVIAYFGVDRRSTNRKHIQTHTQMNFQKEEWKPTKQQHENAHRVHENGVLNLGM